MQMDIPESLNLKADSLAPSEFGRNFNQKLNFKWLTANTIYQLFLQIKTKIAINSLFLFIRLIDVTGRVSIGIWKFRRSLLRSTNLRRIKIVESFSFLFPQLKSVMIQFIGTNSLRRIVKLNLLPRFLINSFCVAPASLVFSFIAM